jgi:hypothetical protein
LRDATLRAVSLLIEDLVHSEPEARGIGHLEEVLQSECFKRAATLRGLLLYLWKNRDNEISEYVIAVEGLGRNRNFESKIDASVRVQISRLRQFLAKYYESEGRYSRARLVIPLGTHQIQFVEVTAESEPGELRQNGARHHAITADGIDSVSTTPSRLAPAKTGRFNDRFLVPILSAIIVVLVFCVGWLLWSSVHQDSKGTAASKQDLPLFWKTFMDNGKHTRIVLPTPVFFSWSSPILMARDVSVNDFSKGGDSAPIADLERKLGKPRIWRNYTVASDTFASLRLARFLDSYGIQASISSSTESPQGIIDHENIIALGTLTSLSDYQSDVARLSFALGPYPAEDYVVDKRLPAGSAGEFPTLQESASRTISPGIIALLPRGSAGNRILIVQGLQTTALISYLISEDGMREITRAQSEAGNSPFFEAVVLSEVNGGNPIQSRLAAFRPFNVGSRHSGPLAEASLSSSHMPVQDSSTADTQR